MWKIAKLAVGRLGARQDQSKFYRPWNCSSSPHHTTTLENILDSHNKSEMRGLGGLLYYLICQAKFPTSYTVTFYANVFNI